MVTKEQLSSDIDLIKEFESLKLKQSLLIESLKNKKKEELIEDRISEMHSKLDQLLAIFLEAKDDDGAPNSDSSPVLEKLSELTQKVMELDEKVSTLNLDQPEPKKEVKLPSKSSTEGIAPPPKEDLLSAPIEDKIEDSLGSTSPPPVPKSWNK